MYPSRLNVKLSEQTDRPRVTSDGLAFHSTRKAMCLATSTCTGEPLRLSEN